MVKGIDKWVRKKLIDIAPLQRGFDLPKTRLVYGDYPVVYSNGIENYHKCFMAKNPGVVTGRSGTIGKVTYVEKDYWPHNTTLWVTDFKGNIPKFIFYLYNHIQLDRFGTGSGVPTLNRNDVHAYKVTIPPTKEEQTAIAIALSDTDALIQALEKLIAKKRLIKQGAMQELLKPKEGWVVKKLGEIADILKGNGLSKSKLNPSGKNRCILYGELFTTYNEVINDVISKTNSFEGKRSIFGDILLPGSTTTTGIDLAIASALMMNNVLLSGDIIVLRKRNNNYHSSFMSHLLTHIKKYEIAQLTKGITIHHLHGKDLNDIEVSLPDMEEQTRTANILLDMDAEISALEAKLAKYKQIKQGMMQELLTGRIRLL